MRAVITRVLPDPAPARISSGPSVWRTASRCAGFSEDKTFMGKTNRISHPRYDDQVGRTLVEKVWERHAVRTLANGQTQLYIGLHLIHEVTSPQAFDELVRRGWPVAAPDRTFATLDHIVPTGTQLRPFADTMAETMTAALERNCKKHGIPLFDLASGDQGIVHVIGPELGLTQPGM